MREKQYKTPPTQLARVMEKSRERWKKRAAQKQRTIRSQRVTIRDLQTSRDHWRSTAVRTSSEVRQLRAAVAELRQSLAAAASPPLGPTSIAPRGGQPLGGA